MQYERRLGLYIKRLLMILLLFMVLAFGVVYLEDRKYIFCGIVIVFIGCGMMYYKYSKTYGNIRRNVIIAVLTAMAVMGRFLFAPIPGFKPVTAIIIISAVYIGEEAGFMVGSLTALVSDLVFGLGPWTPFQMTAWGMVGYVAGMRFFAKRKDKTSVMIAGAVAAGIWYSLFMDIWSVISVTGVFDLKKYGYYVVTSIPYMCIYVISNIIFIMLLKDSIGGKLDRISKKHGII